MALCGIWLLIINKFQKNANFSEDGPLDNHGENHRENGVFLQLFSLSVSIGNKKIIVASQFCAKRKEEEKKIAYDSLYTSTSRYLQTCLDTKK